MCRMMFFMVQKNLKKIKRLIKLAKNANVNILRVWGGGLIESELFYRLCDENGLLVWQEFIQSSSGIEDIPSRKTKFLELMRKESSIIIKRKKNHPSLAIWCGGNELRSDNNTIIKDDEPVVKLLGDQVKKLDKMIYYLPSSPSGRISNNTLENIQKDPNGLHDVHGPWEHQGITKQYTLYNMGTSLLSSEFGVEGFANINTLKNYMSDENIWPPSRENPYYFHRGAWWNNYELLQRTFANRLKDIDTFIKASQLMQYEGLKYAVESNRRRAMKCSGTFPWQFNEPYPNNSCTSAVDYHTQPKPAYYGVKKAYSNHFVSAKFDSQTISEYGKIDVEVYFQSSSSKKIEVQVCARFISSTGDVILQRTFKTSSLNEYVETTKVITLIDTKAVTDIFFLDLVAKSDGNVVSSNRYLFVKNDNLSALLDIEQSKLQTNVVDGVIELKNVSDVAIVGLNIRDNNKCSEENYTYFEENYIYLLPNEIIRIPYQCSVDIRQVIDISAFNYKEI